MYVILIENRLSMVHNFASCVYCVSEHAEKYGFGVVERFVGHGIGTVFHSEPLIYHDRQ